MTCGTTCSLPRSAHSPAKHKSLVIGSDGLLSSEAGSLLDSCCRLRDIATGTLRCGCTQILGLPGGVHTVSSLIGDGLSAAPVARLLAASMKLLDAHQSTCSIQQREPQDSSHITDLFKADEVR